MRQGLAVHRHGHQIATGSFAALADRIRHFVGLAVAVTDPALAVTDHNQGAETEVFAALDHLGTPVDRNHALVEFALHRFIEIITFSHETLP